MSAALVFGHKRLLKHCAAPALSVLILLVPDMGLAAAEGDINIETESDEPEHRLTLGVRPFLGVRLEGEEAQMVYGAGLLAGAPVWRSLEVEGSVAIADVLEGPPFLVLEAVGKWVFETENKWSPHVILGPLVSFDIGESFSLSGGVIAGGGLSYWFTPRLGWTSDLNYRLLIGQEIGHVLVLASGLSVRF